MKMRITGLCVAVVLFLAILTINYLVDCPRTVSGLYDQEVPIKLVVTDNQWAGIIGIDASSFDFELAILRDGIITPLIFEEGRRFDDEVVYGRDTRLRTNIVHNAILLINCQTGQKVKVIEAYGSKHRYIFKVKGTEIWDLDITKGKEAILYPHSL